MSVAEMKIEVIKKNTGLKDESVLEEVLELLKKVDKPENERLNLTRNYEVIKKQYGDVLQKLAQ